MGKSAFSKKKVLYSSKLDLNIKQKQVNRYIWSLALYDAETLDISEKTAEWPEKL
jgi:hypothetical protein